MALPQPYGSVTQLLLDGTHAYLGAVGTTPERLPPPIPDEKGCRTLLEQYGTPAHVVDHCRALVGQVKEAGERWATVTLVTDGAFQLAGQGSRWGTLGALSGDLALLPQGELAFTCLTQADPVQAGEEVVTFAAGESYPSGLLAGTVDRVETDPGGLTRTAVLTPAADLANLGQVFVVTAFEEVR